LLPNTRHMQHISRFLFLFALAKNRLLDQRHAKLEAKVGVYLFALVLLEPGGFLHLGPAPIQRLPQVAKGHRLIPRDGVSPMLILLLLACLVSRSPYIRAFQAH
jgi:hypothetical protein